MKVVIPEEALDTARVMRGMGIAWGRIARTVGFGEERIRRILDPAFAARRAAGIRQARHMRAFRGEHQSRLSAAEARAAIEAVPPDTRSTTSRLLGDPLPGRSALDRRTYQKQTLAVRKSADLLAPKKHGVFMEDHLKSGKVV